MGGYQVISPSATICKMTKAKGQARAFKTEKPFHEISADEDCFTFEFMKYLFENHFEGNKPREKHEKVRASAQPMTALAEKRVEGDKWLDLLFNVIKNERNADGVEVIGWDEWFQVLGILKDNGYSEETMIKYTRLSRSDTIGVLSKWADKKKDGSMDIHGLANIAKRVNPEGYKHGSEKMKCWVLIKWSSPRSYSPRLQRNPHPRPL